MTHTELTRSALLIALAAFVAPVTAQDDSETPQTAESQTAPTGDVVSVKETWVLELAEPDWQTSLPQVVTCISPTDDVENCCFLFEVNHRSLPNFRPGGMQLQHWHGDEAETVCSNSEQQKVLNVCNDTVTFDVQLSIEDDELTCEVVNGTSKSWGEFAAAGQVKLTVETGFENLNAYDPAVSLANSDVVTAKHRVRRLVLKTVSKTYSTGETITVERSEVVYKQGELGFEESALK